MLLFFFLLAQDAKVTSVFAVCAIGLVYADKTRLTVSLAEIEVPDKEHPFGELAWDFFVDNLFNKSVRDEPGKTPAVGKIYLDGKDFRFALVQAGPGEPRCECTELNEALALAQQEEVGIWGKEPPKDPIPFDAPDTHKFGERIWVGGHYRTTKSGKSVWVKNSQVLSDIVGLMT